MGGTQDPVAPQPAQPQPAAAPASAAPVAPAGPNALDTLVASMSRAELLVLASGALLVLMELIFLFVDGYNLSTTMFIFGAVGLVLVLLRKSLPAGVAAIYWGLLFLVALVVTINGARDLLLDLLSVTRVGAGIGAAFLIGFLGTIVATVAMAWAAYLMWRNRTV